MVSTPKGFTNVSPISPMKSTPVRKTSSRKSLCMFTNILDVKNPSYRRFRAAKYKRKVIKYRTTPWALKKSKREFKNQLSDK